jgi:quinol monooxygenase YgiN
VVLRGKKAMILVSIHMNVAPKKRKELFQTIQALVDSIRVEEGCLSCHLYQDTGNKNIFSMIEEWENKEDLDKHLRSECFGVLLGAMNLLSKQPEIKFNTVSDTAGIEALKEVRELYPPIP